MQSVDCQDIIKEAKDCTMKIYFLLLTFFISLSSLASDSLKVKKTEYFEDGKLVRATFFDTLSLKSKEIFINYKEGFEGKEKNDILLIQSENGKYISFKTYHVNIIGDSVFFYNPDNLGSTQKIKYNSVGNILESFYDQMYFKADTLDRTFSLNNIDTNLKEYKFPLRIKYIYDRLGNKIEDNWMNNRKSTYKLFHKFDTLRRVIEYKYIDKNGSVIKCMMILRRKTMWCNFGKCV